MVDQRVESPRYSTIPRGDKRETVERLKGRDQMKSSFSITVAVSTRGKGNLEVNSFGCLLTIHELIQVSGDLISGSRGELSADE